MLIVHKNKDGYIFSYFEYDIVNKDGKPQVLGEYMYVRDIWVHPAYNGKTEISKFITEAEENEHTTNVKHIYWIRTKKNNGEVKLKRMSKLFSRKICLKHKE